MTGDELKALRKLCDEATPGPWTTYRNTSDERCTDLCVAELNPGYDGELLAGDALFIAAAQAALPDLLAEVSKLQGLLKRVEWMGDTREFDDGPECCPVCRQLRSRDHKPDCEMAAALK